MNGKKKLFVEITDLEPEQKKKKRCGSMKK